MVGDGIGVLDNDGIGVLVGDGTEVLVNDGIGVLVGDGGGVLVRDGGDVLVEEDDGVLIGEANRVLVGEEDGEGFSSLTIIGLRGGESSTTSSSSWVVVSVFGMSNRTVLGFFTDEEDSTKESLYDFMISCLAYSLSASRLGLRERNSNLFLLVPLFLVGCAFDQMMNAL